MKSGWFLMLKYFFAAMIVAVGSMACKSSETGEETPPVSDRTEVAEVEVTMQEQPAPVLESQSASAPDSQSDSESTSIPDSLTNSKSMTPHISRTPPHRCIPLLPHSLLDEWVNEGPVKYFNGADLYGHINGGAEVFLELGFTRLDVRRYKAGKDENCLVDVEIYWMDDFPATIGIYLMHCGKEKRIDALDVRHTANRYQIQFFMGNAYVKINNPRGNAKAGKALPSFACHVVKQLSVQSDFKPEGDVDLFSALPVELRVKGSERVIRGPFTLERIFYFGQGDLLLLGGKVTALAADYMDENDNGHTFSTIIAPYKSAEEARAAFANMKKDLDSNIEEVSSDNNLLVFKDNSDRFGTIELKPKRIEITVNLTDNPTELSAPQ